MKNCLKMPEIHVSFNENSNKQNINNKLLTIFFLNLLKLQTSFLTA